MEGQKSQWQSETWQRSMCDVINGFSTDILKREAKLHKRHSKFTSTPIHDPNKISKRHNRCH